MDIWLYNWAISHLLLACKSINLGFSQVPDNMSFPDDMSLPDGMSLPDDMSFVGHMPMTFRYSYIAPPVSGCRQLYGNSISVIGE